MKVSFSVLIPFTKLTKQWNSRYTDPMNSYLVTKNVFCDICLKETHVSEYDGSLLICSECIYAIKRFKVEQLPSKLPKEQTAGGTKDEL